MRIGVGLSIPELATRGGRFSPASLFTGGVQGAWYAPDDFSTLFQDSAGTTPVTAVEQPVGLMLDKSQGLAGTQQINDPSFDSGIAGWGTQYPGADVTFAWNSTLKSMTVTRTGAGITGRPTYPISVVAGTWYKITFITNAAGVTNSAAFSVSDAVGATAISGLGPQGVTSQTTVKYGVATTTGTVYVGLWCNQSTSVDILSVEITAVAGNHASQATAASRPVLRARYNLLTYSEQFDNAAWTKAQTTISANAVTAPDGTTTADKMVETAVTNVHGAYQTFTYVSGATYSASVYAKQAERSWIYLGADTAAAEAVFFDLANGTVGAQGTGYVGSIQSVGDGWYRCTVTITQSTALPPNYFVVGITTANNTTSYLGDITKGVYLWGADLRTGSSAGTYQRIAAATDYATAGFLPYLYFDGADDSMATGAFNISSTDKLNAVSGSSFFSSTANAILYCTGSDPTTTAGTFALRVNTSTKVQSLLFGSSLSNFEPTIPAIPSTNVLSHLLDIGAAINLENGIRVNGASATYAANSAGTGNFSATAPFYLGRLGGTSNPINAGLYQIVVCGKTLSASELASTEAYVATKTGVTI